MIYALMKLDAYTMKPLWKMAIAFLLVPVVLGIVVNSFISIMVIMTFIAFLLNTIFSISETSGFDRLYGIVPVGRNHVVLSRYLFSMVVIALFALVAYVVYLLLSLWQGNVDVQRGFAFLGISTLIACFFISIQFPIYFRVEYSKASFMSIVPYIVCFAIGSPLITQLMKQQEINQFIMKFVLDAQQHLYLVGCGAFVLSLALLGISYQVAKQFNRKKYQR